MGVLKSHEVLPLNKELSATEHLYWNNVLFFVAITILLGVQDVLQVPLFCAQGCFCRLLIHCSYNATRYLNVSFRPPRHSYEQDFHSVLYSDKRSIRPNISMVSAYMSPNCTSKMTKWIKTIYKHRVKVLLRLQLPWGTAVMSLKWQLVGNWIKSL